MVVMLDCGGRGSILASEGMLTVREAVEQDWRALECIRAYGLDNGVRPLRVITGSQECPSLLREVRPDVVVGDACRRFERVREKEGVSGGNSLAQAAIVSDTRGIILKCLGNLLRRTKWNDEILPALERDLYIVDKSGDTGEPSRDSVEEEMDVRGRNQRRRCHKGEVCRLESEVGEGKATS